MPQNLDLIPTTESEDSWPYQMRDTSESVVVVPRVRIVEARPQWPSYFIPLLVLTLILLVIALSLLARLIDAIGRPITGEQVSILTFWAFGLTGVGLALLVGGGVILPRASLKGYSISRIGTGLLVTAVISCETAYLFGPLVVDRFEANLTAAERQCAVQLRLLAMAGQNGATAPPPADIRTLLMRGPIAGLTCDNEPTSSPEGLGSVLRGMIESRRGTAEQLYNNDFIPSVRSLRDAFDEYVAAQLRLVADIRAIPDKQAQAWGLYLNRLTEAGLLPNHIPRQDWHRIVAQVRDDGVAVPLGWNPGDQVAFMAAIATTQRQQAESEFNEWVLKHFKQQLPPGLDWTSFYGLPTIQSHWRSLIGAPPTVSLSPEMGFAAFRESVYEPQLNGAVLPQVQDLLGSPDLFAAHGKFEVAGRAGAAWAVAPLMLFWFVLLSILLQTSRLVCLACTIVLPKVTPIHRMTGGCVGFVVISLAICTPLLRGPPLQSDPDRRATIACASNTVDCATGIGLQVLWSLGSGLRNTVLLGFSFGYDPTLAATEITRSTMGLLPPAE